MKIATEALKQAHKENALQQYKAILLYLFIKFMTKQIKNTTNNCKKVTRCMFNLRKNLFLVKIFEFLSQNILRHVRHVRCTFKIS